MSGGVEVGVVTEATQVLEVLLEATKEENSKWKLLMLYVHRCIHLLLSSRACDDETPHTLVRITLIGAHHSSDSLQAM